jgi:hypothetical protein
MNIRSKLLMLIPILVLLPCFVQAQYAQAQTVTSFDGMDALSLNAPSLEIDGNGAVGTLQYMEWVNSYYQAYSKTSPYTPVWSSPQNGDTPWQDAGMSNCYGTGGGEGTIEFDRLASVWVIARRASQVANSYYYCIAVSNTADLTSSSLKWYTYQFQITANLGLNSHGNVYYPDFPRFATWADGYYATFDLEDPDNQYQEIGVVACAFDRANMIIGGTARAQQCFSNPSPIPTNGALYLEHSLIPADIDSSTAPATGRHEYLVSIQNPPANGTAKTSTKLNLWNFHVNWTAPTKSTFGKSQLTVTSYEPGCYDLLQPANTFCVTEPSSSTTGNYVDSIGDRLMPRMPYHNFGTYESYLVSHTVQVGTGTNQQTGIRWYELRGTGTGNPTLYQSGTVTNGSTLYRFVPSIAQDKDANAGVGYSVSSSGVHPGIRAAYWSLPSKTAATEITLQNGTGDEENSSHWGNITSMTVDPVDGCTFWYQNQYYQSSETGTAVNWDTRISNFKLSTCN